MPSKPGSKIWDDTKILMTALAVTTTLGLWNLFATIDRTTATQETASLQTPAATDIANPTQITSPTQPVFLGKILLGGQAPRQQTIIVQRPQNKNSQNSQRPAPVTQTRSS